ncbi:MAG: glycosyltransferase, partial [Ignavibacteria bacterium]|nr:glycosyltransferase [Ignavibacteria bacterium]
TGELANMIESRGLVVHSLSLNGSNILSKAVRLFRLLRNRRFDVLHTHLIHATLLGRIVGWLARVPVIISTEHNTSNWQNRNVPALMAYRTTERFSRKTIAISEAVRRCVMEIGKISSEKIEVLYNGVDLDELDEDGGQADVLRTELGISASDPLIGTVGRMDKRKGYDHLIRAMIPVLRLHPSATLLLVGDGVERNSLTDLSVRLGLGDRIIFAGSQTDIRGYVRLMDVFVLPSLQEGLSISLIEAMALQRAVVASNVDGIPEVVSHGVDGVLVEPGNEEALADALCALLNDKPRIRALGAAARQKVERQFNIREAVTRLEGMYRNLARGTG